MCTPCATPRRVVFYIGEGSGERVYAHVRAALRSRPVRVDPSREVDSAKTARIRDIVASGGQVEHLILRSGLATDKEALVDEQAVIDAFIATGAPLTNLVNGHGSGTDGLSTVEGAAARVAAPRAAPFPAPAVIVMINRAWRPDDGPDAIYAATRGHWNIGARSREADRARLRRGQGHHPRRLRRPELGTEPAAGRGTSVGVHGHPAPQLQPWLGSSVRHLVPDAVRRTRSGSSCSRGIRTRARGVPPDLAPARGSPAAAGRRPPRSRGHDDVHPAFWRGSADMTEEPCLGTRLASTSISDRKPPLGALRI